MVTASQVAKQQQKRGYLPKKDRETEADLVTHWTAHLGTLYMYLLNTECQMCLSTPNYPY